MKRMMATLSIAAMMMPLAGCIPAGSDAPRYGSPAPQPQYDSRNQYDPRYDATRDYRDEPGYDRPISRDDNIYRGNDGRYYCKRSNGTTGLVIGGIGGGTLGAILGGGGPIGILLGGAAGAILGKSIDKGEVRCR